MSIRTFLKTCFVMGLCFLLVACTNKGNDGLVYQVVEVPHENETTIEEILQKYGEGEVINITHINEDYVLIESQKETESNQFVLYNLKSGVVDVLPTYTEYISLEKIENENHIIFLSSGISSESSLHKFPYYICCVRVNYGPNQDSFIRLEEDKYYELSETVTTGSKEYSFISEIVPSIDGLQVKFEPIPGQEANFYAADVDIPVTTIYYDENIEKMIVDIMITNVDEGIINKLDFDHPYLKGMELIETGENIQLLLDLRQKTIKKRDIKYIARIKHIPGEPSGFPILEVAFK